MSVKIALFLRLSPSKKVCLRDPNEAFSARWEKENKNLSNLLQRLSYALSFGSGSDRHLIKNLNAPPAEVSRSLAKKWVIIFWILKLD